MPNPVQDRVKTEWEKAQKEGGQRVERIRDIVKTAAVEALAELREGSSEIETQGRKTLSEMIEQLRANEAADAATAEVVADAVAEAVQAEAVRAGDIQVEVEAAAETETTAPTWGQIFADLRYLANDRKVDWAQRLLSSLQTQIDRFDADMVKEHSDRYGFVRPLVRGIRSLVAMVYGKISQSEEAATPNPVHIEVLDDSESTSVDDSAQA